MYTKRLSFISKNSGLQSQNTDHYTKNSKMQLSQTL